MGTRTWLAHRCASLAWHLGLGLATLLLGGCAAKPRTVFALEAVGPLTGAAVGGGRPATGYLEVYTESEPYNDGGFVYYRNTPYTVYDEKGQRVKSVVNRVGMTDQRPMLVSLRAGRYRVYARAEGYGLVEVPVVIAGARLTQVHLDRGGAGPRDAIEIPEAARVRLPDGRTVGRQAEPPAP